MAIVELFSKRQKRLRGEVIDVFQYDEMPESLRNQIVIIIDESIGTGRSQSNNRASFIYKNVFDVLCREYGVFDLHTEHHASSYKESIFNFIRLELNIEKVLDAIELLVTHINDIKKNLTEYTHYTKIKITPKDAINELNYRFRECGFGFQIVENEIVRMDSTYMHSEVVKPVLRLLGNPKFEGAQEEYLSAHDHYKHGKNKECLTDCLKAFESTMKIICTEKGWAFNHNDTARKLIKVCMDNDLIPIFAENQFNSLKNLLESGVPTIRNKFGGHGQGQTSHKVADELTRYSLNLTGTNIIFLIELSGL